MLWPVGFWGRTVFRNDLLSSIYGAYIHASMSKHCNRKCRGLCIACSTFLASKFSDTVTILLKWLPICKVPHSEAYEVKVLNVCSQYTQSCRSKACFRPRLWWQGSFLISLVALTCSSTFFQGRFQEIFIVTSIEEFQCNETSNPISFHKYKTYSLSL